MKPTRVGVWGTDMKSHPAGVRGLKLANARLKVEVKKSHPAGVRGLKP